MISSTVRQNLVGALQSPAPAGGHPDPGVAPPDLGSTLSALKALRLLGARTRDPDAVHSFVASQFDPASGAWVSPEAGAPDVLASAAGLLCLHELDATGSLTRWLPGALDWMTRHARTREEHFMTIAVVTECQVDVAPTRSVAFFRSLEQPDGTFGAGALQNAIAASALLRAGERLTGAPAVADVLLSSQSAAGGFTDTGSAPDLWTSYCVMRAVDLMGLRPQVARLAEWVIAAQLDDRPAAAAGSTDATYQCLSILDWIATPVVDAARRGDTAALRRHLQSGGDPDLHDLQGWTPLAAAAVRGHAPVVRLLLGAEQLGGKAADPDKRVPAADALPLFWAGQAGDLDTVRAILDHRPEQLFATSSVNGHTLLLQAAFFGTERHRDLIAWLLEHAAEVLKIPPGDTEAQRQTRHRLLAACNVRGYTATTMSQLWNNEAITAVLSPVDDTTPQERDAYRTRLLASIAVPQPSDARQRAAQQQTDALLLTISQGLDALNAAATVAGGDVEGTEAGLLSAVTAAIEAPGFDLDRLGGPLAETPVIAAVTGVDADRRVTGARLRLTSLLLEHGADPDLPELHPMGVDAVIRAAVLNHVECLQEISRFMGPLAFAAALNERPAINGQTALDDTVHRALTASDDALQRHLDQISWAIAHGARTDIPDFTGVTVAERARLALDDTVLCRHAPAVLSALTGTGRADVGT